VEIILHRLFELDRTYAVGFLNGIFHRDVLVQYQIEVSASFRQFLLVKQVVHDDPRLRVVERVMSTFVARRGVVLHGEKIGQREPDLGAEQFGEGFWRMLIALVTQQILGGGGNEFGVAAEFDLFVVDANRAEILGEAFVEPSLGGGIVVIQQHHGEVVRNRSPGLVFEQVQHDEVLIVAGEKKSGDANGLHIELARLSFNVSQGAT